MRAAFAVACVIGLVGIAACGGESDEPAASEDTGGSVANSGNQTTSAAQMDEASAEGVFVVTDQSAGDATSADSSDSDGESAQQETHQTTEEAAADDLALVAEGQGWTIEEAQMYEAASEAVGDVAVQIAEERPEIFVGSAVGPEPSDPPRLYIKGPADEFVTDVVDAAPVEILVVDNQPYSRSELDERTRLLSGELGSMGFAEYAVSADIQREGLLEATVVKTEGAPESEDEIIALLPDSIKDDVSISVVDVSVNRDDQAGAER